MRRVCTWAKVVSQKPTTGVCGDGHPSVASCRHPLILSSPPHALCPFLAPWQRVRVPSLVRGHREGHSCLEHMHGSFMTGAAPRQKQLPAPAPRKPSPCSSPRSACFSLKSFSPHQHNHWVWASSH